jgi:hypothetical protein
MKRTTVAAIGFGLALALMAACGGDQPSLGVGRPDCLVGAARPCSPKAEMGKAYRYQVPHCGLISFVDFDESHWDVDKASMNETENGRFGINSDEGTMTLEAKDVAVYRSDRGGDATLHRHEGALKPFLCG